METALKNNIGITLEMPSIDELLSNDDILKFLNDNKSKKNPYDVDFKEMLNAAAEVNKRVQSIPSSIDYTRSSNVFAFLNRKSSFFQKEIVKEIAQKYFTKVPSENFSETAKNKLKKIELISINVAFKAVSGHNYTSLLNVLKSQVYNNYGRETLKAVNYLRLSNLTIDDQVNYSLSLDASPDTVIKVRSENESLFYPSFYLLGFKGLNQYKELKELLMKKGLTTKGWKTMCSKSRNFNLRAMRKVKLGIFALNHDLKDAWLRNSFVSEWVKSEELMKKVDVLLREMSLYNGPVNKFSPFPIENRMRNAYENGMRCTQLQEIDDFLSNHPNDKTKSLVQLYKKAQDWHLELRKLKRSPLIKFEDQKINSFIEPENKFIFEQIEDSWKLQDEGELMHHCVYSYARSCKSNEYLVYTVKSIEEDKQDKKDLERATLGLNMQYIAELSDGNANRIFKYSFSQMYSYCNARVSEEMHKSAKVLLKELNKSYNNKLLENKKMKEVVLSD